MEPVVFVSCDPTFMPVHNGLVPDLIRRHTLVDMDSKRTVQTRTFLKRKGRRNRGNGVFRTWYNFSRTAGSVLRMFMLEASGMRRFYNPPFKARTINSNQNAMRTENFGEVQMAHSEDDNIATYRAKRFAADFDRLFPHCYTEYKLKDMGVGQMVQLSGLMYVIYFDERIIYYILTTMNVKLHALTDTGSWIIHASVRITVKKYKYNAFIIHAYPLREEIYENYILVRRLVEEWRRFQNQNEENVEALASYMRHLNLNPRRRRNSI